MGLYQNILLPLDGSDAAEKAVPHAEALTRSSGGKISIVHVLDSRKYIQLMLAGRRPPDYLNRVADRLNKNGIQKTEIEAPTGDPAKAIITYSEANACDIIVMTGRTRYGVIGRLGGVAARVFRASKVPVLSGESYGQVLRPARTRGSLGDLEVVEDKCRVDHRRVPK